MRKLIISCIGVVFCFGLDQNLSSLKADFIQYTMKDQKGGVYYSGSLLAQSPSSAKWEYKTPIQKIVYLKDSNLISYEPMLSQAVYMKMERTIDFLKIIQSAKQDKENPNLYKTLIDGKLYLLHTQNAIPSKLEYEDELGNHMVIELQNVILNSKIPKKEFEFVLPKGVDVIKH
ncbi:LolA-like outer membrane lipoprotein chaperone [Helicobacter pametensis]|uniref:LolA-like outer membrane lipoprotein chaperone n=1 Tax=Helicobacter pametensis TaxID=95149 RepID=UPI000484828B|nr:LolA-like outer membrane lipoprotein chaperone [Helicobacter pametensis]